MQSVIIDTARGIIVAVHEPEQAIDPALYGPAAVRADLPAGLVVAAGAGFAWAAGAAPANLPAATRATTRALLIRRVNAATAPILDAYPAAEILSWPTRAAEAKAVLAAHAAGGDVAAAIAGTVVLASIAAQSGIDTPAVVALAGSIGARAAAFGAISASVEIAREAMKTALAAATTPAEIADAVMALAPTFAAIDAAIAAALA